MPGLCTVLGRVMVRSERGSGAAPSGAGRQWSAPVLPWTLCFIRRGSQLLLLERRREPNLGLWSGVGGKLEPGELPREGVIREVREETGLDLPDLLGVRFAGVVTWRGAKRPSTGAYAFVAFVADDFEYSTPREKAEGVLDWKEVTWVLDAHNERIPASARRYLQTLLEDSGQYEHQFTLDADGITGYVVLPLPA